MGYLIKYGKNKELYILSFVYLLSQGFLIIASGRWWDDWCFINQPYWVLRNMAMQMGRPTLIAIIKFAKFLPEPGYRIITFLIFYWCMLFLYKILKEWLSLSDTACFWICALYVVIPTNDARMLLACFPYSIAVFFFMAGMSYLSGALSIGLVTWKKRLVCYLLFIASFTMNSNLVFYAIVLLMILMKERNIKALLKYVDFIMLPIIFFMVKSKYFPACGIYANYNSVTIGGMLRSIKMIIPADIKMIQAIFSNYRSIGRQPLFCIVMLLVLIFVVMHHKKIWTLLVDLVGNKNTFEADDTVRTAVLPLKENVFILIIGVIVISAGLFAYVEVRGTDFIRSTGLEGRDSVLVAFGAAMIIYALYSLVLIDKFKIYMLIGSVMCGIVFFNIWYLSYQQDYYRQLGFQYQLIQHRELEDTYNIIYLNDDPGLVNIQSFYVFNGNSELALGRKDKLIMSGFSETSIMDYEMFDYFVESGNYHMNDYDHSHKRIDAIVDYSFDAGLLETVKLKLLEAFDHSWFENKLHMDSNMVVYMDGSDEYDQILADNGYWNLE